MIIGSANCGKTFMLSPLQTLFKTFSNPANDKYAWIGVDEAGCIFLNDFRWSNEVIAWKDFLPLLEGQEVHLPSPKNQYARDLSIKHDAPIFATGKERIRYVGKYMAHDEHETEMMKVRWNYFSIHHQIAERDQRAVAPCNKCFGTLVLQKEL